MPLVRRRAGAPPIEFLCGVKLLFDENLSPRLPARIHSLFPESAHVLACGLGGFSDEDIWQYALAHEFSIVSKDGDFRALSVLRGAPPKVVLLNVGNVGTAQIEQLIVATAETISEFVANPDEYMLVLHA